MSFDGLSDDLHASQAANNLDILWQSSQAKKCQEINKKKQKGIIVTDKSSQVVIHTRGIGNEVDQSSTGLLLNIRMSQLSSHGFY